MNITITRNPNPASPPDGDYGFPLGHLREHLRTGEPVYIEFERIDGVLVAMRVSDAD